MKYFLSFLLLLTLHVQAQIDPKAVTIARDSFGVPHIFAKTDPEVSYGLAWAHSEDDFKTIQTLILTGKGKLGTYLGKKGAPVDFVFGLLNTRKVVDQQIKSMDPKFLQLVQQLASWEICVAMSREPRTGLPSIRPVGLDFQ